MTPLDRAWRRHAAQQWIRRALLKCAGLCPSCGDVPERGRVYCAYHRAHRKLTTYRRAA